MDFEAFWTRRWSVWQTPVLVVLGAESTGKSTLMERLIMMNMFPRAKKICTRVPILVRLRNAEKAQAPTLAVQNVSSKAIERGPTTIPMQGGELDVREAMQEILEQENKLAAGVASERIIIIEAKGPRLPCLDLVDMPGVVQFPPDLMDQTVALIERHVATHGAYSMYLAISPAAENPRNSSILSLVEKHKLQPKTLGVFTKCDKLVLEDDAEIFKARLQFPPPSDSDGVSLSPHGWVATMSR